MLITCVVFVSRSVKPVTVNRGMRMPSWYSNGCCSFYLFHLLVIKLSHIYVISHIHVIASVCSFLII